MDRRQALLSVLALPLGSFNAVQSRAIGAGPGRLLIPLDQWSGIEIEYKSERIVLPVAEIFRILKGRTA